MPLQFAAPAPSSRRVGCVARAFPHAGVRAWRPGDATMPGYQTQIHELTFGQQTYVIRALTDKQQFADPDDAAADAGISSAQWSLFGQVWPAGRLLAEAMATRPVEGRRILELGCGLGLASLVLRKRGADVVASDHHPLAEVFLAYNAALNALDSVPYRRLDWDAGASNMGQFDMIIASDVLYETRHATMLAKLIPGLAKPACEIVVSDPGRGNANALSRMLADIGFSLIAGERQASAQVAKAPRLFVYRRKMDNW